MTTMTAPTKTSDADIVRIDAMVEDREEQMMTLAARWIDEHEYEDIADYRAVILPNLPTGIELTKMTTRPFGFHFTIGNGATYHFYVTARTLGWKRIR